MKRRILSIITALALCLSLCPTWALAVEADPSLCKHHPEHIGCGYAAPTEGQPCGHQHTAECYTPGVLPDGDSGDPYEVGGDTENPLNCHHSHDSECGYVQADPGTPCGYECRICPIEDLIAALPEQVTEDNADGVRAQLDHILDLYRELDEGEQEEINLSRIYALQGALDAANVPMTADGSTEQQETDEASVTINGETLYYATLGDAFDAANGKTAIITMLTDAECVHSGSNGSPLNINSGTVTLNLNGKTLSGNGYGAQYHGIVDVSGGSLSVEGEGKVNVKDVGLSCRGSGKLTVEDITLNLIADTYYAMAGVTNQGGTVILNGTKMTGAASDGQIDHYSGTTTINNVTATGTTENCPKSVWYEDGGTLKINGGTFDKIVVGGDYYFGDVQSVAELLGEGYAYKKQEGTWATADDLAAMEISNVTVKKIPLTINPQGDTSWYYSAQQTHTLAMNAAPVNGSDSVAYVWKNGNEMLDCTSDAYTVPAGTPVGSYTYTCEATCDGYTLSHTFTFKIEQSGTEFTGGIKTYNGSEETTSFSADDTITVKAAPTATGTAPKKAAARLQSDYTAPTEGQMALFVGDVQVSEPVNAVDGTYTMEVSAADVLLDAGGPGTEIPLTAKFVGNDNMADGAGTVKVSITAAAKAELDGAVIGYYDESNLASAFAAENTSATVTLLKDVELSNYIQIENATFTLDLNGHNISKTDDCAISLITGANLTICGSGKVTGYINTVIVTSGATLTLEGGSFSSSYAQGVGVKVQYDGALNVTGAGVKISNLCVQHDTTVSLTAGTYDSIEVESPKTLAGLLGTDKHYAYYRADGTPVLLSELEGQTKLTGPVTVQECQHTGVEATNNGDGTHSVNCPYCGYTSENEPHSFNETGYCPACKLQAAAKVEKDGSATAYVEASGLNAAFTNEGATVTLLDNITTSTQIEVDTENLTLDLNGKTYTYTGNTAFQISSGSLTIKGSGAITASSFYCLAVYYGTLNIKSGSFSAKDSAVYVVSDGTLQLTGGSFTGDQSAIAYESGEVTEALANYGGANAPHYAFYQGSSPYTPSGRSLPSGTFIVQECQHKGVTPTSNSDGTHALKCPYCGYSEDAVDCAYVFSGMTGTCAACGDSVTVAVAAENLTYDGTEKKPSVTVIRAGTELTVGTDYTVAYSDNKNAGENKATVTITIGNGQGSYTENFSIGKATPTITWSSTTQELTYTGQQAAITAPTVTLVNNESFGGTIHYSYTGTTSGTGLPTNAGTYTIKAHVDAAGNYNAADSTNELTLTIKPTPVTLTFANQTITYGDTPTGATADPASAKIEYSYTTEADGTLISGWPTNAGTYTVTAKVKATGNYGEATATAQLTINKAPLTITGATVASKTYDTNDTATVTGVTFTGLVNGETLALGTDYTATGIFADANAGENKSVTVTVTLTSDKAKNYSLAQNTTTATSDITKANSSITKAPTASGITYGQALSDSALTDGAGSVAGAFTWTAPATKPNAGTAQFEVTFTPTDTTNYDTAKASVTVTIAKATPTLTAPTAGAIQYGQKLSDSTLTGGSAVNPYDSTAVAGNWSWASGNTQPTATGPFPVAFVPSDTANYNTPENVDTSVTVNTAAPKITLTVPAYQVANGVVEVKYTAANPHDATLNDLPAVTLTYKVGSGAEQPITDGKFTIPEGTAVDTVITVTASTAATDGKYTAAAQTATVTVTDKIPVEISGVTVTGRAYNGSPINRTGTPVVKTLDGKAVNDATVTYTWSSGGDTGPTNVGDYTLIIAVDDGTYIGSTTVSFTIAKATITITAADKSAVVGSAKPELTYTVSGLAPGETLATEPTLTCDPDMNTVGSYPITASGAAVPSGGNYNADITYVAGTLTVTAKPSGGGGGYVPPSGPSTPSTSLPVTTTGQSSSTVTTTTTAAPTATTQGGTATTTINTTMGNEIVRQAVTNNSETVVIAPKVTGSVTKTEVSIPASTVGQIGSQTNASLTVSTPVADVTIPNGGLGSLSSAGGTVTVTAKQVGNSVELSVTAGGRTVQNIPGGVTLTVPAANTTPGTVAVLVHVDGTREVVRKSVADNGTVTIPLDGSAKLEIVNNSKYFADVPATSWAADAVAFASAHELFNGTSPTQFSPDLPMSRGMLAVVLHNLESNPAQALTDTFADVDNSQWYAEGVAWAAAKGIVDGYGNGQFGPNDNITREQLAVMLWRYAGSPAATDRELHFADAYRASDWALEALGWATENGIINGKGNGILDPTGQATRAETAQMLKNFIESQ